MQQYTCHLAKPDTISFVIKFGFLILLYKVILLDKKNLSMMKNYHDSSFKLIDLMARKFRLLNITNILNINDDKKYKVSRI